MSNENQEEVEVHVIPPALPGKSYGAWMGHPKAGCAVCKSEYLDEIHKMRYGGVSLRKIEATIRDNYNVSLSWVTLSNHFRYHYLIGKNAQLIVQGNAPSDQVFTSLDNMIGDIQSNRSTFFEAVSHIAKARLEQIKTLQERSGEIEAELAERVPPGSGRTGFTNLDRDSDTLYKRWTYIQDQIDSINAGLSKTYIDMQKVIAAEDAETIKNHIFMTKNFLLREFVQSSNNLLIDAISKGLLKAEDKVKMGGLVIEMLEKFEGNISVDFLYQQSIESMKTERDV